MERYPIEYTKNVKLDTLKVGDTIEGAWLWEPRLVVAKVFEDRVEFLSGEVRAFSNWTNEKVQLVKIRMSKNPEWFGK
jgi:hypothetical protein